MPYSMTISVCPMENPANKKEMIYTHYWESLLFEGVILTHLLVILSMTMMAVQTDLVMC